MINYLTGKEKIIDKHSEKSSPEKSPQRGVGNILVSLFQSKSTLAASGLNNIEFRNKIMKDYTRNISLFNTCYKKHVLTKEDRNIIHSFIFAWNKFVDAGSEGKLKDFVLEDSNVILTTLKNLIFNKNMTILNRNLTESFLLNAITNKLYCKDYPHVDSMLSRKDKESIFSKRMDTYFFNKNKANITVNLIHNPEKMIKEMAALETEIAKFYINRHFSLLQNVKVELEHQIKRNDDVKDSSIVNFGLVKSYDIKGTREESDHKKKEYKDYLRKLFNTLYDGNKIFVASSLNRTDNLIQEFEAKGIS